MAFRIIRNDITKVAADAIVNTANPEPVYGGGTDSAIYEAAGRDELLAERRKIGPMEVGEAAATPAFRLQAKYIIHTVGPVWYDGESGELENLRLCYVNSLKVAEKLGCESIAYPLISTGVYGFPKDKALQIAVSVFSEYLSAHEMEITLVVFDAKSFEVSGQIFAGIDAYIDENYVSETLDEEYGVCYEASFSEFGVFDEEGSTEEDPGTSSASEERRYYGISSAIRRRRGARDGVADSAQRKPAGHHIGAVPPAAMAAPMGAAAAPAAASAAKSIDDVVAHISDTWQESLLHLIDERGFTDVEVYKRANVDRKLFSKIRSNPNYQPKKITAVAFALALELNLDDTRDMLARAGYALSPSSKFDLIVEYFIDHEVYDTYTINLALFEHDQPLLGE